MARGSSKNFDSTLAAEFGSVPLPVVVARIDRFIVENGKVVRGNCNEAVVAADAGLLVLAGRVLGAGSGASPKRILNLHLISLTS